VGEDGFVVGVIMGAAVPGVDMGPGVTGTRVGEAGGEGKGVEAVNAGAAAVDMPVGEMGWGSEQALRTQASSRKGRILRWGMQRFYPRRGKNEPFERSLRL